MRMLLHLWLVVTVPLFAACGHTETPADAVNPVQVKATDIADPAPAMPGENVPAIKINTVGYPTRWRKLAVFNIEPVNAVVRDMSGKVVMRIEADQVEERGVDPASKDRVWQVDFTRLDKPGRYTLAADGVESDPFEIGDEVYDRALLAGLKMFYFQRTRTALVKPYATWEGDAYTRQGVSHVHDDVGWNLEDYPDTKRKWDVEAGWHDAGNFDIYIATAGPTAQALMMAYEQAPEAFGDKALTIPESGNGIPDILDEARWGLRWILSLQQEDGGFRHREAVMQTSPEGPADWDRSVRWIAGVSSSATAKAVAALALASRVYVPWNADFAERAGAAARQGWRWLQAYPDHVRADGKGSIQPLWDDEPGFNDVGARFIAAVAMWRAFGTESALAAARDMMDTPQAATEQMIGGAWANLSRWAVARLALDDDTPAALRRQARERILAAAGILKPRVLEDDGYRCATAVDGYAWGHNSNLMEKAHILAIASRLAPDKQWLTEALRDQWHWVLGRNPNGYSMVTRVGKGPTRFYHLEWGNREPPPPGYLLGGPNYNNMPFLSPDAPAKALLWDNPMPLRSGLPPHSLWHWRQSDLWDAGWLDEDDWSNGWWTVTEPDIYYNANLILVAAALR